ncbi:MAG: YbaY family lipoprotein [Xanthomonadales bacterium]|nr:YbaY family lipoprotein [Xanthomonadales bacterium]
MLKPIATVLVAVAVLGGCNSSTPPAGQPAPANGGAASKPVADAPLGTSITGTVSVRDATQVGEGARLELKLVDVAQPDIVIAEATEAVSGQPPFRFTLNFDPARIDRSKTYILNALLFDGERRFVPGLQSPVLTHGAGSTIDIALNAEATPGEKLKEEFGKLKAQIGGMRRIQDAYLDGDLSVAWDGFVDAGGHVRYMRVNTELGEGDKAVRSNTEYAFLDDKPMVVFKKSSGTRVGWDASGTLVLTERNGGSVGDDEVKAFHADALKALAMGQAKAPKKK